MYARSEAPATAPVAPNFELLSRALAVVSLVDLAVVHVIDLPDTLGPLPWVGAGYFAIIAAAMGLGVTLMIRSHWVAWAAAGLLSVGAMGGYLLTRSVSGFLGDHGDVGNWRCSLGITALSLETVLIVLAAAHVVHHLIAAQPQPERVAALPLPTYSSVR
ncbi:MAG TPA: hypothetical protein VHZ96_26820 [Frankiaceae bacterium]|jgi:hypothetical protein|nr:hypothetical protein [Frankiaceae bacterium]